MSSSSDHSKKEEEKQNREHKLAAEKAFEAQNAARYEAPLPLPSTPTEEPKEQNEARPEAKASNEPQPTASTAPPFKKSANPNDAAAASQGAAKQSASGETRAQVLDFGGRMYVGEAASKQKQDADAWLKERHREMAEKANAELKKQPQLKQQLEEATERGQSLYGEALDKLGASLLSKNVFANKTQASMQLTFDNAEIRDFAYAYFQAKAGKLNAENDSSQPLIKKIPLQYSMLSSGERYSLHLPIPNEAKLPALRSAVTLAEVKIELNAVMAYQIFCEQRLGSSPGPDARKIKEACALIESHFNTMAVHERNSSFDKEFKNYKTLLPEKLSKAYETISLVAEKRSDALMKSSSNQALFDKLGFAADSNVAEKVAINRSVIHRKPVNLSHVAQKYAANDDGKEAQEAQEASSSNRNKLT